MWSMTVTSLMALIFSSFFTSSFGVIGTAFLARILSFLPFLFLIAFFFVFFLAILFYFAKHKAKQCFSDRNSVCRLLKIRRMRRAVNAFVYFPNSRQGVHYLQFFF